MKKLVSLGLLLLVLAGCSTGMPFLASPRPTLDRDLGGAPATETPVATLPQQFRIGARAASSVDAIRSVALLVRQGTVRGNTLTLRIAFENTSDDQLYVSGTIPADSVFLTDADGKRYSAVRIDANLSAIQPTGGFAPGAANVGDLVIQRPVGRAPFELRLPNFQPLRFSLDDPLEDEPPVKAPNGTYPVGVTLHSTDKALVPIELRVLSARVETETIAFNVSFVNTFRQGYQLVRGPTGEDAYLLDGEGAQAQPLQVSDSMRDSIGPPAGWLPGGQNAGIITFARPILLNQARFVFPGYSTAAMRFDGSGLVDARVTSAAGGMPRPTATPEAQELVFRGINRSLMTQAQALLARDEKGFLATFTLDQRPRQQTILKRAGNITFASYSLELNPDQDLPTNPDSLDRVPVLLRYTLRGISSGNSFLHPLRCSFSRQEGEWLISGCSADADPPFWWTGDVVQQQSEHFLVFTRPQVAQQLPGLMTRTEAAYQSLAAQGLPMEPRYVAFFTADQKDFVQFTDQATLLAGIALWRFEFQGDDIVVHSRAFYINGNVLARNQGSNSELQVTIAHELVHLVLAPVTRPFTPSWLAEGAAVYFSRQNSLDDLRRLVKTGRSRTLHLGPMTDAEKLGGPDASIDRLADSYVYAGAAFSYLVGKFGQQAVLGFYRSYADMPAGQVRDRVPSSLSSLAEGDAFHDLRIQFTTTAVQRAFSMSLADLDEAVQAWLVRQ